MHSLPRRRSCLTVPGASEKMLAKALALPADEIVLDLEDAVPVTDKAEARSRVAALLGSAQWRERTVSVRINAIGTAWYKDDLAAVVAAGHPTVTLIVPKVEGEADLRLVEKHLAEAGSIGGHIGLQVLVETAAGVANAFAIAGSSPRLQTLIIGYADLASSLGRPARSQASWQTVQDLVLLAARAHGLQPIDGPFFRIDDEDALHSEAARARAQGFEGKWAIHPLQIEPLNVAFTPDVDEIADARSLIVHLNQTGGAATSFAGGMVDEAMRLSALRTLARAGLTE